VASNSNFGFNVYAAVGIPFLNRKSRGIFEQGKPKPQKLGRTSLRQFAVLLGLSCPKI
jgi:hypothetical protein